MKEMANDQGRTLDLERKKHLDAMRTLKNSEADLLKAREDLKEVIRARDNAESGPASAQKQAEDQIRRLLETEERLQIANEQIVDLKKKLAEVEGAKNVAEWARDEALRAKEEAEFARAEAKCSKEKAEEEAYNSGVAETQAALKAQVPRVCGLYCSQVWNEALKQVGVDASSNLWKVECVFYPPAIREDATPSSEVKDAPEEVEVASPSTALLITSPEVPAKESGPFGAARTDEGQNPDTPKEIVRSVGDDPISHIERPVIVVEPLQSVPLGEGSKDAEVSLAQPSQEGVEAKSKE